MAAICNSGRYGTGVILSNQSNLFDGKFEIVLLREKSINTFIDAGLTKFNESFFKPEHTSVFSGSDARLYFDEPRLLQLDGELIGEFAELDIELLQGAIRIISFNRPNNKLSRPTDDQPE
jgi:diacylglycerol kinase (ATP)